MAGKRDFIDAAFNTFLPQTGDGNGWGVYLPVEDEAHVIPEFGPEHLEERTCWCSPTVEACHGGDLIVHNVAH